MSKLTNQPTIEIVGNAVYVVEKTVKRIMTVPSFVESISRDSTDSGFIPRNCRRFYRCGSWMFFLFEFDPKKKICARIVQRSPAESFQVDVPSMWNYFLFCVKEVREEKISLADIFFFTTANRLMNGEETVYHPLLPNIYGNGRICTGTHSLKAENPENKMEEMLSILFQGDWNFDLVDYMSNDAKRAVSDHITKLDIKISSARKRKASLKTEKGRAAAAEEDKVLTEERAALKTNNVAWLKWQYDYLIERFEVATGAPGKEGHERFKDKNYFLESLNPMGSYKQWIARIVSSPGDYE